MIRPDDDWLAATAHREGIAEGDVVRRTRQRLGYTISDVARHCGVSHTAVWMWERRNKRPGHTARILLLHLFDEAGKDEPEESR